MPVDTLPEALLPLGRALDAIAAPGTPPRLDATVSIIYLLDFERRSPRRWTGKLGELRYHFIDPAIPERHQDLIPPEGFLARTHFRPIIGLLLRDHPVTFQQLAWYAYQDVWLSAEAARAAVAADTALVDAYRPAAKLLWQVLVLPGEVQDLLTD